MKSSLRLYTFVNMYLSSIQQGIQSAHVAVELVNEYRRKRGSAAKLLFDWAEHGKTMIVLNGGMASDVANSFEATDSYNDKSFGYPFAAFWEEPGAIHESRTAMTAWGIVLPPEVYNARPVETFSGGHVRRTGFSSMDVEDITPTTPIWELGSFEHFICTILQGKGLAR